MSGTGAAAAAQALGKALAAARALLAKGDVNGAEAGLRTLHAAQPRDPDVAHLLGGVLLQRGAAAEALAVFAGCPDRHWQTSLLMARAARATGAHATVLECLEPVLHMAGSPDPRVQAGRRQARLLHCDALLHCGRGAEAEVALRGLIDEDLSQVDALALLGVVLQHAGRDREAAAVWEDAIARRPTDAMLRYNRALALERSGALRDAQAGYEDAAQLSPQRAQPWSRAAALAVRRCDFDGEARMLQGLEAALAGGGAPSDLVEPLLATFLPLGTNARGEIVRRQAAAAIAAAAPFVRHDRAADASAGTTRPLRVGYLSADFGAHAVGGLLQPVLAAHDPARVDVRLYALRDRDDALAAQFRAMRGYASVAGLPAAAVAARIADDGIDVLVDLGGYTEGALPAVAAARPAPLQLAWLGFVGSMAASFIDYQIVDATLVPAAQDYSEALLRLPGSFLPLARPLDEAVGREALRGEFGLPAGTLFACFNNAYKIDREVLHAWVAILARVPDAHLLLAVGDEAQPMLRQHWQAMDGNPERLLFAPRIAPTDHLRRSAACDLFLDTFRYHAGATGVAAARAGLPVLCRAGTQPVARMGASLAAALGMDELVVESAADYVDAAIALAGDPARLLALRERLRGALQGGAGDPSAFAGRLEAAYAQAWRRHCAGQPPVSFDVVP